MKVFATGFAIVAALAIGVASASATSKKSHDQKQQSSTSVFGTFSDQLDHNNKCWVKRDSVHDYGYYKC